MTKSGHGQSCPNERQTMPEMKTYPLKSASARPSTRATLAPSTTWSRPMSSIATRLRANGPEQGFKELLILVLCATWASQTRPLRKAYVTSRVSSLRRFTSRRSSPNGSSDSLFRSSAAGGVPEPTPAKESRHPTRSAFIGRMRLPSLTRLCAVPETFAMRTGHTPLWTGITRASISFGSTSSPPTSVAL